MSAWSAQHKPAVVYIATASPSSDEIVYIGISVNFEQRVKQHREGDWWGGGPSRWVTPETAFRIHSTHETRRAALDAERALIERHQPVGNIYLTDRDPRMAAHS